MQFFDLLKSIKFEKFPALTIITNDAATKCSIGETTNTLWKTKDIKPIQACQPYIRTQMGSCTTLPCTQWHGGNIEAVLSGPSRCKARCASELFISSIFYKNLKFVVKIKYHFKNIIKIHYLAFCIDMNLSKLNIIKK